MNTNVDVKGLSLLIQEASGLSKKIRLTGQEERRSAWLLASISAMKQGGITLQELDQADMNEREVRAGLKPTQFVKAAHPFMTAAQESEARGFQHMMLETRGVNATEGAPMNSQIGTYSGLGTFVPTAFFQQLFAALKAADDIFFDDDFATVIRTTNSRPMAIPTAGDTEVVASVVSEGGSQTQVDIDATGHAVVGGFSYSTPRMVFSLEAFQDLDASFTAVGLFKKFALDRFQRGVGADLLLGSGVSKPLGLIPALIDVGAPVVIATGTSESTGGAQTGANSVGVSDFKNAFEQLDQAYANDPSVAWIMNRNTLAAVSSILDKYGNIVKLVNWTPDGPEIFGIPVVVSPSMEGIGASQYSVVLGAFRYWATRLAIPDDGGIHVYREAPGLIEQGNVGVRAFLRADGALLYTDASSPSPFVIIQQHS
jgi:HK97 family phage major capsid protein